jgi:hypothetical protein
MPSARELLEQADALMRRNRARALETEIPLLTEVVVEVAPGSNALPIAFDDVPELVDAVEEIEIASIIELPEDIKEAPGWPHCDPDDLSGGGREAVSAAAAPPAAESTPVAAATVPLTAESTPVAAATAPLTVESMPVAAAIAPLAAEPMPPEPAIVAETPAASRVPIADDWARWEALAEEIRMQVLQRIDIFTDTRLRKQLSAQLQPIVDRASVQMVETINEEVGRLLRAYIAEAIEREIDKWRGTGG